MYLCFVEGNITLKSQSRANNQMSLYYLFIFVAYVLLFIQRSNEYCAFVNCYVDPTVL